MDRRHRLGRKVPRYGEPGPAAGSETPDPEVQESRPSRRGIDVHGLLDLIESHSSGAPGHSTFEHRCSVFLGGGSQTRRASGRAGSTVRESAVRSHRFFPGASPTLQFSI